MIPFVDLTTQYLSIKDEIDEAIQRVILNSSFIGGEEVKQFEESFARWLGITHFIGCANGTDSIEILLKANGVGPGDEVIVPALTWISTSEAVSNVGASPVFVDVHEDYYTINEDLIEAAITRNTKAIIPVHLYGQPCDMIHIMEIAKRYGIIVIEDCAQAHGAMWKGQKVGTFGECASFSFFPSKNLGAYGDSGGMATNNSELAHKTRIIGNHGQIKKHEHVIEGRNSRLDALQAAILSVKLQYLDNWNSKRRAIAQCYFDKLNLSSVKLPLERKYGHHVFHLFVMRTRHRDNILAKLQADQIGCAIHYPCALPFLPMYFKNKSAALSLFPVAHRIQSEILSLPIYPELSDVSIATVCEAITASLV